MADATAMEMRNDMSLQEYIEWTEIYPHTKEAYMFTKECYELDLLEKFVRSNQYVLENSKTLIERGYGPTITWMMESTAPTNMVKMHRDAHYGAFFLLEKILRFVTWPFRALAKVLRAIYDRVRGGKEDTKKLCDEAMKALDESQPIEEILTGAGAAQSAVADAEAEDAEISQSAGLQLLQKIRAQLAAIIPGAAPAAAPAAATPAETPAETPGETPAPAATDTPPAAPPATGTETPVDDGSQAILSELDSAIQSGQVTTANVKGIVQKVREFCERDVTIQVPGLVSQIGNISQAIGNELVILRQAFGGGSGDSTNQAQRDVQTTNIQQLVEMIGNSANTSPESVGFSQLGERIQTLEQSRVAVEKTVNELNSFIKSTREQMDQNPSSGVDTAFANTGKIMSELQHALTKFNAEVGVASKLMTEQMARGPGRVMPVVKDGMVKLGGWLGRIFGVKKTGAGVMVDPPAGAAPAPA